MKYIILIITLMLISVMFYEPHREVWVDYAYFPCDESKYALEYKCITIDNMGIRIEENADQCVVYNNIIYDMVRDKKEKE